MSKEGDRVLRIFSPHGADAEVSEGVVAMGFYPRFVTEGNIDSVFVDLDLAPFDLESMGSVGCLPLVLFRGVPGRCQPLVDWLLALGFTIQSVHAVDGPVRGVALKPLCLSALGSR